MQNFAYGLHGLEPCNRFDDLGTRGAVRFGLDHEKQSPNDFLAHRFVSAPNIKEVDHDLRTYNLALMERSIRWDFSFIHVLRNEMTARIHAQVIFHNSLSQ